MSTTYGGSLKLGTPAANDPNWNTVLDANRVAIQAQNPVGALAVSLHETPSASLNVDVQAGPYIRGDGSIGTYAGTTSFALTASNTNYLFLDGTASWALTKNTTGFPTTPHVRLATAVVGTSTITSITDARICFAPSGNPIVTDADGATITFDLSAAKVHVVTLGGNRTLALSNVQVGDEFTIALTQDGTGSRTVTWWSGIAWGGGSPPTLTTTAAKTDTFKFLCPSAGVYWDLSSKLNH